MLDIKTLKKHNSDILKAEIGALLFNMGKTHVGFKEFVEYFKEYFPGYQIEIKFSSYKKYYYNEEYFFNELKEVSPELENFFRNLSVYFLSRDFNVNKIELLEIMKAKESSKNLSSKIFFRGCENINSGVDKGTPEKQIDIKKIPELFIANAFGTFKQKFLPENMDGRRKLFWNNLHKYLDRNRYYSKPNWKEIRNWMVENMKSWYSSVLSDNRFPANDVTLWDQVYMVASMFKAVLANICLIRSDDSRKKKVEDYFDKPANIKWRIMGIQYDKIGLAERGFKPAQIEWYRKMVNSIDEQVKCLIENYYSLGNEIYRDETGIYFLVGEDLGADDKSPMTGLHPDLQEVKSKILDIFNSPKGWCCESDKKTQGEFFPAIFLTKPSRGLMNLTFLLENAGNNFLETVYPKDSLCFDGVDKSTICPVCRRRAFSYSDRKERGMEDMPVCDVCYEKKTKNRIDEWLNSLEDETIWTSELQDRNGRIALVTMKFELKEWLNGNMLNSFLIRQADFPKKLEEIRMFFRTFFSEEMIFTDVDKWLNTMESETKGIDEDLIKNCENTKQLVYELKSLIENLRNKLFKDKVKLKYNIKNEVFKNATILQNEFEKKHKKGSFKTIVEFVYDVFNELGKVTEDLQKNIVANKKSFTEESYKKYITSIDELIERIAELQKGSFFVTGLAGESYYGCKNNDETFNDWIRQIFFGSIMGNEWEDFVKNSNLGKFINWDTQTILWDKWTKDEIDFFSVLLLQFIIRKNPSPARLRRIWETTKEFFSSMENNIIELAGIPEERCGRLFWEDTQVDDGEYCDGELVFWAKDKRIYLISPIPENKDEFILKPCGDTAEEKTYKLSKDKAVWQYYKPYFAIIEPTPVSWQFAIPAEYVPSLIASINRQYNEYFKLVYGKLPLHTGVIIQDYKKPLYIGIKALRKIRRNNIEKEDIKTEIRAKEWKLLMGQSGRASIEYVEGTDKYYMLYETSNETMDSTEHYNFYLFPDVSGLKRLKPLDCIGDDENITYFPNTFDFEFLDTNTRRNEIFYRQAKRVPLLKKNRPYTMEEAQKMMNLGQLFINEVSGSQFHKFITQLYDKYESWNIEHDERNVESFKLFLVSLLLNVSGLSSGKKAEFKKKVCAILEISNVNALLEKSNDEIRWITKLFFDSFEFWHKALKGLTNKEQIK